MWNVTFVACIQTIEFVGTGYNPENFPQRGKIYTLESWETRPDGTFLTLEEFGDGVEWNSNFFKPLESNFTEFFDQLNPWQLKAEAKLEYA